jgi:hypothetical protein
MATTNAMKPVQSHGVPTDSIMPVPRTLSLSHPFVYCRTASPRRTTELCPAVRANVRAAAMNSPNPRHPTLVLGTLVLVCLAAFLGSIPLPRADGQLLGGDGFGYYVYLPSLVLDHDLDFTNQVAALTPGGQAVARDRTPTGLFPNLWPAGPALLWLPFFLLAHSLALALDALGAGIRLDGCGYWHQAFVIAGNIAYGGVGIALAFGAARRVASTLSALWSTVLLVCAGNLVYYLTAEPSMAHPVSVFAVGAFYWLWMRSRGGSGARRAAVLGASVGLVALVRTQELLLVAVPLAADLAAACRRRRAASASRDGAGHADAVGRWARDAMVMSAVALVVYAPQTLVSHALFGTWWKPPQLHAGWAPGVPLFSWASPHLLDVLVSARRGLLTWHPVFALAILGVIPLWRKDRWLAAAVILGVLGQAYVIGGWFDWLQGRAFGGRAFIGCLPLFAMSLGVLTDALWRRLGARRRAAAGLAAGLAALLVAANLLLVVEYRLVLSRTDRPVTWRDLGRGRIEAVLRAK